MIRLATLSDIPQIAKIVSKLDTEHCQSSDLDRIRRYIERSLYYIAEEDHTIISAMVLNKIEGSYQVFLISSRKKGGGKALIEYAVWKCRQEKIKKLWCWSLTRYQARGFYEKMGFDEIFLLKNQWYGEDCYFLGKNI